MNQLIKLAVFIVIMCNICCIGAQTDSRMKIQPKLPEKKYFELLEVSDIIVGRDHPDSYDNKYGYEGGVTYKIDGVYHLFTAERFGDPGIVKMRLGYWTSKDGLSFERKSTLFESTGSMTGDDMYASIWSPMPIWDEKNEVWQFFYVAYKAKENDETGWYLNHDGRIWRATSSTKGRGGIGGPYENIEVILAPEDSEKEPWEGLQGVDSFFPFQVGKKWYGFYGSAQTQRDRNMYYPKWAVGLAEAESLDGEWKRMGLEVNPVIMNKKFVENPVVSRLPSGEYLAVFDSNNKIGYSTSKDGLTWRQATFFPVEETAKHKWWQVLRTPLGIVEEGKGFYSIYFTAYNGVVDANGIGSEAYASIGRLKIKLTK